MADNKCDKKKTKTDPAFAKLRTERNAKKRSVREDKRWINKRAHIRLWAAKHGYNMTAHDTVADVRVIVRTMRPSAWDRANGR